MNDLETRVKRNPRITAAENALLVLLSGPHTEGITRGSTWKIGPLTTIGRLADSRLVLPDSSVSRTHCTIEHRADGWWITDEGSANGTIIAGRQIEGGMKLAKAETIVIGDYQLLFFAGELGDPILDGRLAQFGVEPDGLSLVK